MTEMELLDAVESAIRREENDDHLNEDERRAIVKAFLTVYHDSPEILKDFPQESDIDSQFVFVIYGAGL